MMTDGKETKYNYIFCMSYIIGHGLEEKFQSFVFKHYSMLCKDNETLSNYINMNFEDLVYKFVKSCLENKLKSFVLG